MATAAIWTSAGMIVLVEPAAGLRAELSGLSLMAQTAAGALFGLLVIALKMILHQARPAATPLDRRVRVHDDEMPQGNSIGKGLRDR